MERAIEVQQDLYLCFIDYSKAFDKVKHSEIIKLLENLNVDGKDLRIVRNMYWKQTAAMRVNNTIGRFQKIEMGVRQGCVMSPDLFSLYTEYIMRNIEDMPGIKVGGCNINNLRYADDTVLIAGSEQELQALLDKVVKESENKGLSLNKKKTEIMVVSKYIANTPPRCNIIINDTKLAQVEKVKYLGTLLTSEGRCLSEIRSRTAQAKSAFQKMRTILCNRRLSMQTRIRVLRCYIEPILFYGCEAWTVNKKIQSELEATEMWFLRRMMKIPWTAKKTNAEVLIDAGVKRSILSNIRGRQSRFLGHVLRRTQLEHLITTGKIKGRRDRGRQREKLLDGLVLWHGRSSPTELIDNTRDRESWRNMIAYAIRHGT